MRITPLPTAGNPKKDDLRVNGLPRLAHLAGDLPQ
jgi:hypothetical protein